MISRTRRFGTQFSRGGNRRGLTREDAGFSIFVMLLPATPAVVDDSIPFALYDLQPAHFETFSSVVVVAVLFASLQMSFGRRRSAVGVVLRVAYIALETERRRGGVSQQDHNDQTEAIHV